MIFGGKKSYFFSHGKTWSGTVAERGFQMFYAAFSVKPGVIHLAAWSCSMSEFIRCVSGGFRRTCHHLLPVSCRERRLMVSGGAGNGCYVKSYFLECYCGFFLHDSSRRNLIGSPHQRSFAIFLYFFNALLNNNYFQTYKLHRSMPILLIGKNTKQFIYALNGFKLI